MTVEQERRSTPDHRVAIYSGVAGAALAGTFNGAFNAEAAVVYKSVDITLNGNATSVYDLSFSGTANATFRFRHIDNLAADKGSAGGIGAAAIVQESAGNNVVVRFTYGQQIQTTAANSWDNGVLRRLFSGTTADTGTPGDGNFWNGHTGYIGVRYDPGHGVHYGWIHVDSVDNDLEEFHISGYGYQNTQGAAINAGEGEPQPVPEPSTITLALLASGAAGLMRARRKKLLREKKQG